MKESKKRCVTQLTLTLYWIKIIGRVTLKAHVHVSCLGRCMFALNARAHAERTTIDYTKTFDVIYHEKQLFRLEKCGFAGLEHFYIG